MSNNRILKDSNFKAPNKVIIFGETLPAEVTNEYFTIGNNSKESTLTNKLCTHDEADKFILEKDVNRGVTCNNKKYRSTSPIDEIAIDTFIKGMLKIDEDNFNQLKKHYTQSPSYFLKNPLFSCLTNTNLNFVFKMRQSSNLFFENDKIYLELKVKNSLLQDTDTSQTVGYIPGALGYRFMLTADGFKLERFFASSDLLYDLSTKSSLNISKDEFLQKIELFNPFGQYLCQEDVSNLLRDNLNQHKDINRLFDEPEVNSNKYVPKKHYYNPTNSLLKNADKFWSNQHWEKWRELALGIVINDLFDDRGELNKDIFLILNENGQFNELVKNKSPAEINECLLREYFSTFIVGPLLQQSDNKNRNFYDENHDLLSKDEISADSTKNDKSILTKWIMAPLDKAKQEKINIIDFIKNQPRHTAETIQQQINHEHAAAIRKEKIRTWGAVGIGIGLTLAVAGIIAVTFFTAGIVPAVAIVGALAAYGIITGIYVGIKKLIDKFSGKKQAGEAVAASKEPDSHGAKSSKDITGTLNDNLQPPKNVANHTPTTIYGDPAPDCDQENAPLTSKRGNHSIIKIPNSMVERKEYRSQGGHDLLVDEDTDSDEQHSANPRQDKDKLTSSRSDSSSASTDSLSKEASRPSLKDYLSSIPKKK